MAASDHVNPYQMKLFMQAKELMDMPSIDFEGLPLRMTYDHLKDNNWVYNAHQIPTPSGKPLGKSIKEEGVKNPILIEAYPPRDSHSNWVEMLHNGNHRTVVANDINPEMWLPVTYGRNTQEGLRQEQEHLEKHGYKPV